MNKSHRSSLTIVFIVVMSLILSRYWLDLEICYGIIFLIIAAGYAIHLNFKAVRKEQKGG